MRHASKYGNLKTEVDGIVFDSRREAHRYRELRLLERAGVIRDLRLQPAYELQAAFRKGGKHYPAIRYIADFEYVENNRIVIEDVKGVRTKEYRIKKKLFEARFSDLTISEV